MTRTASAPGPGGRGGQALLARPEVRPSRPRQAATALLPSPRRRREPGPRERGARVVSGVHVAATVTALFALLLAGRSDRPTVLEELFGLVNVPVAPSLLSVAVLGTVSWALLTRKRAGLVLVMAFQVVGVAVGATSLLPRGAVSWFDLWQARGDFGRVLDVAAVGTGLVALGWLWSLRRTFSAPLRVRRAGWAVVALVAGGLLTVAATAGLIELVEADGASPRTVARAVLAALGGVTRPAEVGAPPWVVHVTAALAAITLLGTVVVLLRPASAPSRWSPDDEVAVRTLLHRWGAQDSLGYVATRRDKSVVFSPDGDAVLAYRVVAGVSLAAADPVGRRESWPGAIRAWIEEARANGWTPAVVAASEDGAHAYAAAGLLVGRMGDEAVLHPEGWSPLAEPVRPVARAARHARRAGIEVSVHRQEDLDPATLAEVVQCAEDWRGEETERGFSMALGRGADPADGRVLHVLARDGDGRLRGLLAFVPWGEHGVSLDVMRRGPDAPNGVTELMVVDLLARARGLGIARVSLNFCLFRDVLEGAGHVAAGSTTRAAAALLGRLDRFWQLERLYRFSERFGPEWVPRFHCYDDPASLPHVALAAGIAEGFVPVLDRTPAASRRLSAADLARVQRIGGEPAGDEGDGEDAPRLTQQERERRRRLDALRARGVDPYPPGVGAPADTLAAVASRWAEGSAVEVVARVRGVRDHGGVLFVTLVDGDATCQAVLEAGVLGADPVEEVRRSTDAGDLVRVTGRMAFSRNGTPGISVDRWRLEAKALRPLPFSGGGGAPAARLRDRSADLIVRPAQLGLLRQRSAVVSAVRRVLEDDGYLEVETPILQAVHGGASARPFETWGHGYGQPLSLRIAPELFLKRLLVGGLGPVFEIGRNFRNEGVDATHNPEFTALEAYRPHGDHVTMRLLVEDLVRAAATAVHGSPLVPVPTADRVREGLAGVALADLGDAWPVVPVLDAVSAALDLDVTLDTDPAVLARAAARQGLDLPAGRGTGTLVEDVYGALVEPATATPTFFTDFPQVTTPLARPHRSVPGLVERWDLVIAGTELATGYTELTDPLDQRERLTMQSRQAAAGDPEAMEVDEEFLRALELGMPPAGGLGVGLDRLVMLLTNTPIRSVLAFPFVRPEPPSRRP